MFLGLLISDIFNFSGASGTSASQHTQTHQLFLDGSKLTTVIFHDAGFYIIRNPCLTQYGEEGGGVLLIQTGSSDASVEPSITQVCIHDPQNTSVHDVPEIVME